MALPQRSNCTLLELKLAEEPLTKDPLPVLIVPYWN